MDEKVKTLISPFLGPNGKLSHNKIRCDNLTYREHKQRLFNAVEAPVCSVSEALYWITNHLTEFPKCGNCGKILTSNNFKDFGGGYYEFCSRQCMASSPLVKERKKQSYVKRYGVESPLQCEKIRNKKKQTTLLRFGVEYATQSTLVQEKTKQTNLERYGVPSVACAPKVKNKKKQTNLERYGVEYPLQNVECMEKKKKTNINRYSAEHAATLPFFKEKSKQTNLERYGVEHTGQVPLFKEKSKQTNLERYGVEHILQSKKIREKCKEKSKQQRIKNFIIEKLPKRLEQIEQIENVIPEGWIYNDYSGIYTDYNWKHTVCDHVFQQNLNDGRIPRCPKCFSTISKPHKLLIDRLIFLIPNINIEINDRQQIKPLELDIWFPDYNVGVEINGAYWHQDFIDNAPNRLLNKTELCKEKGIQLLHFWDYEIDRDVDLVVNIILTKLGLTRNKIGARKLSLIDITWSEAKLFLDLHHLQGAGSSGRCAGLYLNDKLLVCAVIGKARYSKKDEQELYRFCVKRGWSIPGALSRLVKNLRDPSKSLISYADRRYSDGRGYLAAGFQIDSNTNPNYFYMKNGTRISRIGAQKHKLPRLLGEQFDLQLSEYENMINAGYLKLSDCGNIKMILKN